MVNFPADRLTLAIQTLAVGSGDLPTRLKDAYLDHWLPVLEGEFPEDMKSDWTEIRGWFHARIEAGYWTNEPSPEEALEMAKKMVWLPFRCLYNLGEGGAGQAPSSV